MFTNIPANTARTARYVNNKFIKYAYAYLAMSLWFGKICMGPFTNQTEKFVDTSPVNWCRKMTSSLPMWMSMVKKSNNLRKAQSV